MGNDRSGHDTADTSSTDKPVISTHAQAQYRRLASMTPTERAFQETLVCTLHQMLSDATVISNIYGEEQRSSYISSVHEIVTNLGRTQGPEYVADIVVPVLAILSGLAEPEPEAGA